jgi:tRNA(fMet)-specific endonuclease VapC
VAALIDASLLIAAERGKLDLGAWLGRHADETFAMGAITLSELWHGVHRAETPARRGAREIWVRGVTERFPIVPFDAAAAEVHAQVWANLARRGVRIGAHDLILAATALATGAAVATANTRELERVPGLRVLGPR